MPSTFILYFWRSDVYTARMYFVFVWILRFSFFLQTTGYRLIFCDGSFLFIYLFIYLLQCREYRMPMHHKHDTLQWVYLAACTQANGKLDSIIYTLRTTQLYLVNGWIKASDNLYFLQTLFTKLSSCASFAATVCKQPCSPVPVCAPPPSFIATCKQRRVYQFPIVILRLSAPSLHMIIDSIKRGPSIASRHLDLHLYSRCDSVLLMQWNLSLAQGGVEGRERVLIRPPSFISISLSSLSTLYELAL